MNCLRHLPKSVIYNSFVFSFSIKLLFFVSGVLVILGLLFFTPCFFYIPKASLAAVIIAAVVFMVEVRVVKPIWRSKSKYDLWPCPEVWHTVYSLRNRLLAASTLLTVIVTGDAQTLKCVYSFTCCDFNNFFYTSINWTFP